MLGARERDDAADLAAAQELDEERGLELARNRIGGLGDAHRGLRLALELDGDRVLEHLLGEARDGPGQGGGEEQGLAARGQVPEDPLDVGEEAHVQHAVGLVEHEDLEALEPRVGEAEVVEQAAGSGHDHVDAGAKRVLLRAHAHAPEDGGARERGVHGQRAQVLVDLGGQLAGGGEDEGAGGAPGLAVEALQDGQDEGGGLAAARSWRSPGGRGPRGPAASPAPGWEWGG